MRLPKRLARNPIINATAELRFSSSVPSDAVLGLLFPTISRRFGKLENLPILQIPATLRESEPNLKFQPLYKFEGNGGTQLLIGPHSVALGTGSYTDWSTLAGPIQEVVSTLLQVGLFERVLRAGLRYVNFFEGINIYTHSTMSVTARGESISNESLTLKAEGTSLNGFKVVTQIANPAMAEVGKTQRVGSIVDIDVIKEPLDLIFDSEVNEKLMSLFADANEVADQVFFNILADEFIQTFDPEY